MNRLLVIALFLMSVFACLAQAADLSDCTDLIGFVNQGKLSLMDINSKTDSLLINSGKVQDFCWNNAGSIIFYLEYNEEDAVLTCKQTDLKGQATASLFSKKITSVTDYDDNDAGFLQSTIYLNAAQNPVISIDYGLCYPTMREYYVYDLSKSVLTPVKFSPDYPLLDTKGTPEYYIPVTENKDIINKPVGDIYELYTKSLPDKIKKSNEKSIRLTNTEDIERDVMFSDGKISFIISPDSSRIIFGFEAVSGDLEHGFTMSVMPDGTGQQLLSDYYMLDNDLQYGWTSDHSFIYADEIQDSQTEDTDDSGGGYYPVIKLMDKTGAISVIKKFNEDSLRMHYRIMHPD